MEADSYEKAGCPTAAPDNCVWTPAPTAPNPKPPHPTAASFDGYSHLSGACRSTPPDRLFDESQKMTGRPAYIYRKRSRCETWPPQKGEASHQGPRLIARIAHLWCTLHPTLRTSWCILIANSSHPWMHPSSYFDGSFITRAGTTSSPLFRTGQTRRRWSRSAMI